MNRRFIPKAIGALFFVFLALTISAERCLADEDQDAKRMFDEGMALVEQERYQEALEAFEQSHRLRPRAAALINMAMCLKELHRYSESIALLERLLNGEAGEIKPKMREAAETALAEMREFVAKNEAQVAPNKAEVSVDEKATADTPVSKPLPRVEERPQTKPLARDRNAEAAPKKNDKVSGVFIGGVVASMLGVGAAGVGAFFSYKGVQNWKEADAARKRYSETGLEEDKAIYTDIKDVKLPLDRVGILTGFITAGVSILTSIVLFSVDSIDKRSDERNDRTGASFGKDRLPSFVVAPAPGGVIVSY